MNRKTLILTMVFFIVLLISVIFVVQHFFFVKNQRNKKFLQNDSFSDQEKNKDYINSVSCGNNKILFNVLPVSLDNIFQLTSIGAMSPPDHVFPPPHVYFYVIDYKNPKDISVPVYSPGDLTLTQMGIRHYKNLNAEENYTDYTLVFSRCSDVDVYFHYVTTLTYKPFIDAANKLMKKCNFGGFKNEEFCSSDVNIPILERVQIGTSGDIKAGVYGLDMGVRDYRINGKNFTDASRICGKEKNVYAPCYAVCPFNYFPESIKKKLVYSDVNPETIKKENLSCGTIYTDISGTAQGYWFPKNSGKDVSTYSVEAYNLYIGPDPTKPSVNVFSTGYSIKKLDAGKYDFIPKDFGSINRNPGKIIPDENIYCYELETRSDYDKIPKKITILQMIDNSTLKVETLDVMNCSNSLNFDSDAAEFVR